jgi:hypothetical protein
MNLVDAFFTFIFVPSKVMTFIFVLGWLGCLCFAVVTIVSLFMDFIDESKDRNERRRN